MKFLDAPNLNKRHATDLLVLPFWKGKKHAEAAAKFTSFEKTIAGPIENDDFKGKEGEFLIVYAHGQKERIALLGLGEQEKITVEKLRRAYSQVTKAALSKKLKTIAILPPSIPSFSKEFLIRGITEGLLLSNYIFDKLKHDALKENPNVLVQQAYLIGIDKHELALATKYAEIADAVYFTRDLVNDNADTIHAQHLAKVALDLAKKYPKVIKTTVFDKKRIEKEKMGLLLAVNRSSAHEPRFIIINYRGNPKSQDHTVIVGKGITFDTGGLNLKSTGMEIMKCDMSGAALCLGTVLAAAKIGLKANFTAVIPATDNSIGPNSYKPADVYTSYSGKTVEIGNTDAEGRLILADALAYANKHLHPTRLIDFATLTGAVDIALGSEATGLISNNDALADSLIRAGSETFERLWRLPMYEEYRDQLKSDIADIKSTGGRSASTITASLFLHEFVGKTPWAHCDIASTAFLNENKRYLPKHATGVGVRLMIHFLENQG